MKTNTIANNSNNSNAIRFTDWQHEPAELVIDTIDADRVNIHGEHDGIDVTAMVHDVDTMISLMVIIQDVERKGINIVSTVTIDKELFDSSYNSKEFAAVKKAAQEAVQSALTYANLYKNESTTSIEKLNGALKNFSSAVASELIWAMRDNAERVSVRKNAELVAA